MTSKEPLVQNIQSHNKTKDKQKQKINHDWSWYLCKNLVIAQNRQLDLWEGFTYELGQIPPSIGSSDGGLCTAAKAKLSQLLEKKVMPSGQRTQGSTYIMYGIALLHILKQRPETLPGIEDLDITPQTSRQVWSSVSSGLCLWQIPEHFNQKHGKESAFCKWSLASQDFQTLSEMSKAMAEIPSKWLQQTWTH